jgi:acetylornithine/N-succinyldiaminopimelate aminotransferase
VRGRGLLLALDVERPAADVVASCLARGLLVGSAGEHTLRLTPPLTITSEELASGLELLEEALA